MNKKKHAFWSKGGVRPAEKFIAAMLELFERILDKNLLVRRLNVTANRVTDKKSIPKQPQYQQMDFFSDYAAEQEKQKAEQAELTREKKFKKP